MIRNLFLIAKTVWIQALRRKDIYVVMILALIFAFWVVVTRIVGIDSAATASFLMSLGLSVSYILAAVVTAGMASRQLPGEFESRSLYPLLAQPVTRGEVFLGKALGVSSLSVGVLLVLVPISYLPTPGDEEQRLAVLAQAVALQAVALCTLTFFAMMLSLFFPAAVSLLLSLAVFFVGATAINYVSLMLGRIASVLGSAAERVFSVIPDFSIFNQIQRFVDAQPAITAPAFAGIVLYGCGLILGMYLFSAYCFARRRI